MNDTMEARVWAHFTGTGDTPSHLGTLCRQLVDEQRESWSEYRDACASLGDTRERDIECSGFSVRLMYNPGRSVNTLATVTPEEISERPCFLCVENLPAGQRAVLYRDDYLILTNPRPVVPFHLTVAHRAHRPQSLRESIDNFLLLTRDIAPDFTTLYNGPRCGASAPDHLHFQAVPSGCMPVENELFAREKFCVVNRTDHATLSSGRGLGRGIILVEGRDARDVSRTFRELIDTYRSGTDREDEPMVNVIGRYINDNFILAVFPRRAHRPAAFFREDDQKITVSPAVMEMGGVIVTPSGTDFHRLDARTIEAIYREVSVIPHG